MKNKKFSLALILMIIVAIFPKINIIGISGSSAGIRIEDFLALILLCYMLFSGQLVKCWENKDIRKLTKVFVIYFLACSISWLHGTSIGFIDPFLGFVYLVRKVEYFVFVFFGYKFYLENRNNKNKNHFFEWMVLFHAIMIFLQSFGLIGSFNSGQVLNRLTQGRVSSTFNGAYELSAFLLLLLPKYLNGFFSGEKIKKNLFYTVLIFILIFLSQSRISLLAFGGVSLIIMLKFVVKRNNKFSSLVIVSLISIVIGGGLLLALDSNIGGRFKEVSIDGYIESTSCAWETKDFYNHLNTGSPYGSRSCYGVGTDASFNLRVNHWMQLIDGFLKTPIFGAGPSVSGSAADGEYVRVLAESGIVGFTLFIVLLYIMKKMLDKFKTKNSVLCKYALYSMIIGAIFIDVFSASKVMMFFWFYLGYVIAEAGEKNNE